MARICTRSFRPHDDWEHQHLNLLNAIVHGFSAYDDFPSAFRNRLYLRFLEACNDCHCPIDVRDAVFNVLACRCNHVAASVDYYVSISVIHNWRRRVIIAMARILLSDVAVGYDV